MTAHDHTGRSASNAPRDQISEAEYHAQMQSAKDHRAQTSRPISIIDTCSLISILYGQHKHFPPEKGNALPRPKSKSEHKDALFLLDWLSDAKANPPRTLIIPHEVIRELFLLNVKHKDAGRKTLGFEVNYLEDMYVGTAADPKENPKYARGVSAQDLKPDQIKLPLSKKLIGEMKYPEAGLLAEYLMNESRKPKIGGKTPPLRLYPSIDSMLAADEIDHPKGGIVIVDGETTPGGAKYKFDGIYGAFGADMQIGDDAIRHISNRIEKHIAHGATSVNKRHFPIMTNDAGLMGHCTHTYGKIADPDKPFAMTPRAFINGLHAQGLINEAARKSLFADVTRDTISGQGDRGILEIRSQNPNWSNERRDDQSRAFSHWEGHINAAFHEQAAANAGNKRS